MPMTTAKQVSLDGANVGLDGHSSPVQGKRE